MTDRVTDRGIAAFRMRTFVVFATLVLALYLLSDFILAIGMAGVFAIVLHSWHLKLVSRKVAPWLSSLLLTLFFLIAIIVPAAMLLAAGTRAALEHLQVFRDSGVEVSSSQFTLWVDRFPFLRGLIERVRMLSSDTVDQITLAAKMLGKEMGLRLATLLTGWFQELPSVFVGLLILIFGTFSFLLAGTEIATGIRRFSFFSPDDTEYLMKVFSGLCRSVVLAAVLSGFAQSLIYTTTYWIVIGENVALVGFIVFLASFIPGVGAAPLTFGIAAYAWLAHDTIGGALALAITAGLVGVVDNLVRPLVLRGAVNLHPLLAILAVIGGLQVFGFAGIFLGPIVVGMALVLSRIWLESTLR